MPLRFRFCGDDEVPDWILAAINEISRLDTNELKQVAFGVVRSILDPNHTIENDKKVISQVGQPNKDYRIPIAAIVFILQNSVSHEVTEAVLSNELQQIGLPHEHAIVLCTLYRENAADLKTKAKQLSLRCSVPKGMNCTKDGDTFVMNLEAWQANSNSAEKYRFSFTKDQLELMVEEFKTVLERIESLP